MDVETWKDEIQSNLNNYFYIIMVIKQNFKIILANQ